MICPRIGRITYTGSVAPPGPVCRARPLAWPVRSTFTPWRPLRNIWGRGSRLSGRKKIGSYRINPEYPAVLTGERRGNRERALLAARKRPVSDPVQAIAIKPVEDRGPRNNQGANHHRVPRARSQRSDDRRQMTDDRKQKISKFEFRNLNPMLHAPCSVPGALSRATEAGTEWSACI